MKFREPTDIDFKAIADYQLSEEEKKEAKNLFGDDTPVTLDMSDAGYNPETGVAIHYSINDTRLLSDEEYAAKMKRLHQKKRKPFLQKR